MDLRKVSNYNLVDKKEAKIINTIILPSEVTIVGEEMNNAIIQHFETVHKENGTISPPQLFPENIQISDTEIEEIQILISSGKAISWDCIKDLSLKPC